MAFLLSRPQHGHMWNITFIFCHIFTITFTVISPEIQRQPTWPHGNLQPTLLKQPTQQPNISSDTVTHRGLVRSHPYSPVNLKYVWTRSRCTYLILFFFSVEVNSPRSFPASFAISTLWAQSILANEHFAACVWAPVRAFVTSWGQGGMDGGY